MVAMFPHPRDVTGPRLDPLGVIWKAYWPHRNDPAWVAWRDVFWRPSRAGSADPRGWGRATAGMTLLDAAVVNGDSRRAAALIRAGWPHARHNGWFAPDIVLPARADMRALRALLTHGWQPSACGLPHPGLVELLARQIDTPPENEATTTALNLCLRHDPDLLDVLSAWSVSNADRMPAWAWRTLTMARADRWQATHRRTTIRKSGKRPQPST